jgi:hypothetical protein
VRVHLTVVLREGTSSITVFDFATDINLKSEKHHKSTSSEYADWRCQFPAMQVLDAERENHMAVTDSQTLQRLRNEEGLAEQLGRKALNIAVILKNHPQYDLAQQKADDLMAKALALREQILKIETS